MRDFRSGNRRNFGGGGDRRRVEMHDAVCDECGNNCQVPFRPSGDKPIYCSNCFEKQGGREGGRVPRRNFGNTDTERSSGGGVSAQSIEKLTQNIEVLNKKLNTIIELMSSMGKYADGDSQKEKKEVKTVKVKKEKKIKPTEIEIEV